MSGPQVINWILQKVLSFPGQNVIDNTNQSELGATLGKTTWLINIKFKHFYYLFQRTLFL